jgi:hypothetical protein
MNSCRIQFAPGRILMPFFCKTGEGPLRRAACESLSSGSANTQPPAHIRVRSPTLENHSLCANQTDQFAYRFSDFGSVAPPREGLAWKACAGTRPNENTSILLAPAAPRKGHSPRLLHRRTWLVELASALGYSPAGSGDRFDCHFRSWRRNSARSMASCCAKSSNSWNAFR